MLSINGANIIIDPGADFDIIQKHLKGYNIKPDFILNTHGHHDHIGAVSDIILNYKIPFYIHELEEPIITDPEKNFSLMYKQSKKRCLLYKRHIRQSHPQDVNSCSKIFGLYSTYLLRRLYNC